MSETSAVPPRLTAVSLSTISLACVFAVAGVFLVAAVSKLRSPTATRDATEGLGVPGWVGSLLAPVEFAVASLLLAVPRVGSAAAASLFVLFTVLLRRALLSGRTVRCGCFGAGSTAPVTSVSLMRNVALIAASLLAGFAPSIRGVDGARFGASLVVALGVVCGGLLLLALAEVRRVTGSVFPSIRAEV